MELMLMRAYGPWRRRPRTPGLHLREASLLSPSCLPHPTFEKGSALSVVLWPVFSLRTTVPAASYLPKRDWQDGVGSTRGVDSWTGEEWIEIWKGSWLDPTLVFPPGIRDSCRPAREDTRPASGL